MSKSERAANPEQSRNVCLGLINKDIYEPFELENTAQCFTKCGQLKSEACDLGNLRR